MERTPLLNKQQQRGIQDAEPIEPKKFLPFVLAVTVSLGAVSFGYSLGFTSPLHGPPSNNTCGSAATTNSSGADTGTIPILRGHDEAVDDDTWTWFGSLVNLGAMAGAVLGSPLLDMCGRKGTIILSTIPMIAGFWLIFIASGEHAVLELLAGRVLTGISVGLTSVAVPTYIAETAPVSIRGGLGSIFQLGVVLGVMQAYAVGDAFPADGETLYRNMAWVGTLVSSALFVLALFIPKSPRWLSNKGNFEGARASLVFLRGAEYDVDGEIDEMQQSQARAQAEGKASLAELFSGPTLKAMGVMTGLMLFQQLSGINSVIFFSGNIFAIAGLTNASLAAVILGVTQVIVTGGSCLIIDKAGRRPLLMVAGIGMVGMLVVLGTFYFQKDGGYEPNGVVAIVAVVGYIAFFSLGLGAIPWLMMSEVFPLKYRAPASSLMTLLNWTLSFVITKLFHTMVCSPLQAYGTFWLYGGICVVGVFFVLTKTPETKGKTLEEIEEYFTTGKGGGGAGAGNKLVIYTSLIVAVVTGVLLALILT
mmetsp:Transcript_31116/g.81549  ORF Transcript_31116/g.81549 Transcript_31116/m.81549 type:complete len:533 (-) Transcript_31116:39-1637(-)|eukprot:CAMPEP_0182927974 /NCGR_PEP_ID=MMETSP0105_2-20130417/14850_1 /TAXON_ID=81532 ORGANISM="Acanthoeca-like sp., Strain 10tr" /NCGR_SAMPLE_ID=MMETSP0105_2 /ASSEMBLY_ACC=CAM_ASM_000205 /LENGTH=532 /DNA_ID=CAMNT_0025065959 /DNA_START=41 /DNA_END=1639 /DNA_ORIENTATION=+